MEQSREDEVDVGSDARDIDLEATKRQHPLSKVTRELSSEELTQSGTVKMLVASVDRLEDEVSELKDYRERYHEASKAGAVLDVRRSALRRQLTTQEVVTTVTLSAGGALIGSSPSFKDQPELPIVLLLGVVLILGGIAAKVPRLWLGKEGG